MANNMVASYGHGWRSSSSGLVGSGAVGGNCFLNLLVNGLVVNFVAGCWRRDGLSIQRVERLKYLYAALHPFFALGFVIAEAHFACRAVFVQIADVGQDALVDH